MKTTAAVAHNLRTAFSIEEIELPELSETDVLVRMVGVGICHTDIASRDGQLPADFPSIFGHEGSGIVEQVGSRVTKVAPGDHVVLAPDSDGTCPQCAAGAPTYCERFLEMNFQAGMDGRKARLSDGGAVAIKYFGQSSFAHYAVAGERNTVKVRRDLPLRLLGPLGCSIQTGAGTVINGLRPASASSLAVLGVGPVGMAAILGAVACGCARVVAVDRNLAKLALARTLGATHTINTAETRDVGAAIRSIVPRGVDYIVDAAGVATLISAALPGLARRGTLGLVAAAPAADKALDLPWTTLLLNGHTVRGFIEGNSIPDIFIPQLCELHAQGRLPFDRFVKFYPFDDINRAVEDQRNGVTLKPILEVAGVRAS